MYDGLIKKILKQKYSSLNNKIKALIFLFSNISYTNIKIITFLYSMLVVSVKN